MLPARALFALLLLGTSIAGATDARLREHWLGAAVNHQASRLTILLLERDGRLFVRTLDLGLLGLKPAVSPELRHSGEWYVDGDSIAGHRLVVDHDMRVAQFIAEGAGHIELPGIEHLLLEAVVNGRPSGSPVLVRSTDGVLRLDAEAIRQIGVDPARLAEPDGATLHELAGERFVLDTLALGLVMTVAPDLLATTALDVRATPDPVAPGTGPWSMIVGYDLNAGVDDETNTWHAGLIDVALSNGPGTCVHRQAWQAQASDGGRRLDSYCVYDWPDRMLSLTIGDSISTDNVLAEPVRYGGIRIGTDFGLAPGLITQPTLALAGTARVPSTLELWVDQMLTLRSELPPGPFSLTDIPVHTGAGTVQAVVTDILGNRHVIDRGFYSDPSLLAPGLADWSVELGYSRIGFGTAMDEYDEPFVRLAGRRGFQPWLTLGGRMERMADATVLAAEADIRLAQLGILEIGALASDFDGERGLGGVLGFSRRGQRWSAGIRHAVTDDRFVQLGYELPGMAPASESRAHLGVSLGRRASLNVAAHRRVGHDDVERSFVSAALNLRIGDFGALTLSAFEPLAPADDTLISAFLTLPLDPGSTLSASVSSAGGELDRRLSAQSSLGSGPGTGYRVSLGKTATATHGQGEYLVQGNRGRLDLGAGYRDGAWVGRLRATGAVVITDSGVSLTRHETGSLGVVKLPFAGIRLYHDERLAAVTDDAGRATIPGLRPYQRNRLRLALEDLPLATQVSSAEMELVPGRRQAVTAEFAVESTRYVTARLSTERGESVPAGATLRLGEPHEGAVVGHGGLVFLPIGVQDELVLYVQWPQNHCVARLAVPRSEDAVIDLGNGICRMESP